VKTLFSSQMMKCFSSPPMFPFPFFLVPFSFHFPLHSFPFQRCLPRLLKEVPFRQNARLFEVLLRVFFLSSAPPFCKTSGPATRAAGFFGFRTAQGSIHFISFYGSVPFLFPLQSLDDAETRFEVDVSQLMHPSDFFFSFP